MEDDLIVNITYCVMSYFGQFIDHEHFLWCEALLAVKLRYLRSQIFLERFLMVHPLYEHSVVVVNIDIIV